MHMYVYVFICVYIINIYMYIILYTYIERYIHVSYIYIYGASTGGSTFNPHVRAPPCLGIPVSMTWLERMRYLQVS